MCIYLLLSNNIIRFRLIIFSICLCVVLVLCYGQQVFNLMKLITLTILMVWLFACYCNNYNVCYQIDVLTVYFIVWQFIYLMCKWEDLELESPFLILHQASCCVSTSITTYLIHDVILLHFPFQWKIIFLWLYSLFDM